MERRTLSVRLPEEIMCVVSSVTRAASLRPGRSLDKEMRIISSSSKDSLLMTAVPDCSWHVEKGDWR